jgi:hypothetical protein
MLRRERSGKNKTENQNLTYQKNKRKTPVEWQRHAKSRVKKMGITGTGTMAIAIPTYPPGRSPTPWQAFDIVGIPRLRGQVRLTTQAWRSSQAGGISIISMG